jgi:hypothetical protein
VAALRSPHPRAPDLYEAAFTRRAAAPTLPRNTKNAKVYDSSAGLARSKLPVVPLTSAELEAAATPVASKPPLEGNGEWLGYVGEAWSVSQVH